MEAKWMILIRVRVTMSVWIKFYGPANQQKAVRISVHLHPATNPHALRNIIYTHIINYITDNRRSILKVNFQFIYYAVHTAASLYTERDRLKFAPWMKLQIHLQLISLRYIYNKYSWFQFYSFTFNIFVDDFS